MSTNYRINPALEWKFEVSQFAGGEARGICLQITARNERAGEGYVQLTRSDAVNLRALLLHWLDGNLEEKP